MSFYLLNELEVAQIIKREEVENYWKDKDEINGYKLGKEDEKTLMLDDERRLSEIFVFQKNLSSSKTRSQTTDLYKKGICIFQNEIIDLTQIKDLVIKDFDEIKFYNCVIFGDIYIDADPEYRLFTKMNVYFEHSIIFGEVRIGCFSGDYMEIYLWKCCFDQLKIYGHAKIKSVELCYCSGGCLEFSNTNLHEFRCTDSIITAIRSENTKFDSSQLSNTSIDIEKSLNMSINDFQWTSLPLSYLNSSSKINEKKDKEYSNRRKIYDSIQLLKNSPMNFSLKEYINMERKEFLSRDSVLGYLFGKLTDLLVSPLKLFVLILFVIFYFSVIYWDNIFINSSGNLILSLDFSSAFLFSGITFTTIGYGNMVPQDESLQLLAVIEGLIGICAGGAILVALTRKYLDHK